MGNSSVQNLSNKTSPVSGKKVDSNQPACANMKTSDIAKIVKEHADNPFNLVGDIFNGSVAGVDKSCADHLKNEAPKNPDGTLKVK